MHVTGGYYETEAETQTETEQTTAQTKPGRRSLGARRGMWRKARQTRSIRLKSPDGRGKKEHWASPGGCIPINLKLHVFVSERHDLSSCDGEVHTYITYPEVDSLGRTYYEIHT